MKTNAVPTLNPGCVILIIAGFGLLLAAALCRGYVRTRLREAGVALPNWVTIGDDIRTGQKYLELARVENLRLLPLAIWGAGMPVGFLLTVLAIL